MAVNVNEDVLGLDVPIHNIFRVEVFEAEEKLSEVELCLFLSELLHLAQMEEHLATRAQVHDEEQFRLRLKRPVQFDDEWVTDLLHDLALVDYWFDFLLSCQLIFPHNFHRIQSSCILFPYQNNSAKRSSSNDFNLFEIVPCDFQLLGC